MGISTRSPALTDRNSPVLTIAHALDLEIPNIMAACSTPTASGCTGSIFGFINFSGFLDARSHSSILALATDIRPGLRGVHKINYRLEIPIPPFVVILNRIVIVRSCAFRFSGKCIEYSHPPVALHTQHSPN
jgi:hypothetical protein